MRRKVTNSTTRWERTRQWSITFCGKSYPALHQCDTMTWQVHGLKVLQPQERRVRSLGLEISSKWDCCLAVMHWRLVPGPTWLLMRTEEAGLCSTRFICLVYWSCSCWHCALLSIVLFVGKFWYSCWKLVTFRIVTSHISIFLSSRV